MLAKNDQRREDLLKQIDVKRRQVDEETEELMQELRELDLQSHKGEMANLYNAACNLKQSLYFQDMEGRRSLTTLINYIKKQKGFPF